MSSSRAPRGDRVQVIGTLDEGFFDTMELDALVVVSQEPSPVSGKPSPRI